LAEHLSGLDFEAASLIPFWVNHHVALKVPYV